MTTAGTLGGIQDHIRAVAAHGRDTERVGPFLATFSRGSANPFLSYAVPDAGATPSAADVEGLVAAYRRRDRTPRLEYLTELAPGVEPALVAAGFVAERVIPLLACPPGAAVPQPAPDGIELLEPAGDAEILALLTATHEAYDEPDPPGERAVAGIRDLLASGGLAVLARDAATGEAAGGGTGDPVGPTGLAELTGFGVRTAFRRRGIAAAITAFLTAAAHRAGASTVFLTPAGEAEERIYTRCGFAGRSPVLHISHPG